MNPDDNLGGRRLPLPWILSPNHENRLNVLLRSFDGNRDDPDNCTDAQDGSPAGDDSLGSRLVGEKRSLFSLKRIGVQDGHGPDENSMATNMGSYNIGPGPSSVLDIKTPKPNRAHKLPESLERIMNASPVTGLRSRPALVLPASVQKVAENNFIDLTGGEGEKSEQDFTESWKPKPITPAGKPSQNHMGMNDYTESPFARSSAGSKNVLSVKELASGSSPAPNKNVTPKSAIKAGNVIEIDDEEEDDEGGHSGDESSRKMQTPSRRSSPAMLRASVFSQLRDHTHRKFRFPSNVEEWKAGPSIKPLLPAKPSSSLAHPVEDDISLFRNIHSRHVKKAPGTTFMSKLPEPEDLSKAAKNAPKTPQRHKKKRSAAGSPLDGLAKRRHAQSVGDDEDHGEDAETRSGTPLTATSPLVSSPVKRRPPIEEHRLVLQYTVFRTMRIDKKYQGDLMGKIIRVKAFMDKARANQHAASLMPTARPEIARIEYDYGREDPDRNEMFFGRVLYNDGSMIIIYVERETQQFGHIDPSEYSDRQMKEKYRSMVMIPRYDVFMILNTAMDTTGGRYVIAEFSSEAEEAEGKSLPAKVASDDSDSDSDSDSGDSSCASDENDSSAGKKGDDGSNEAPKKDKKEKEEHGDNGAENPAVPGAEEGTGASVGAGGADNSGTELPPSILGAHYLLRLQGSFMTMAQANARALDVFEAWTRPASPPRMNTALYHRNTIAPMIEHLRRRLLGESGDGTDAEEKHMQEITLSWEPASSLRFSFKEIIVVVVKSQIDGPLDLTGAF